MLSTTIYFHCKVCLDDYLGGISAVRKHSNSDKHKKNQKSVSKTTNIDKMNTFAHFNQLEVKKKEAEIRLAMFITEHNISLRTSDHLVQVIKSICPESQVIQNLTFNRTKATALVINVIGNYNFEKLIAKMKTQHFSILIDESTDKSSVKHLAVIVRMIDKDKFTVNDEFCYLRELSHATANDVFNEIITFFKENSIPCKENLVGFASDGAAVIFGNKHSVKTLGKLSTRDFRYEMCVPLVSIVRFIYRGKITKLY